MDPTLQQKELQFLLEDISSSRASGSEILGNEGTRVRLLHTANRLSSILEKPEDAAAKLLLFPTYNLCARVAIQLGVFRVLSESKDPLPASKLAMLCASDKLLIIRILRPLSALNFVQEVGIQVYAATPITNAMASPAMAAGHIHRWDHGTAVMLKFPSYLAKYGRKCPESSVQGPFQYAYGTSLDTFEYWSQQPGVMANFNTFMGGVRAARTKWFNWFPVQEQLLNGYKVSDTKDNLFMVDVGGGQGHDLVSFKNRFSNFSGQLMLQDISQVIDDVRSLDSSITCVKYDFFTEQPVRGARVYFFHFIFHNWADEACIKILKNTATAMLPGYSKLLINDYVLPDRDCPLSLAGMDLAMMTTHAAMERTEMQWQELLRAAGLSKFKIWTPPDEAEGIIEISL